MGPKTNAMRTLGFFNTARFTSRIWAKYFSIEEAMDPLGRHKCLGAGMFQCVWSSKARLPACPVMPKVQIIGQRYSDSRKGLLGDGVVSSVGLLRGICLQLELQRFFQNSVVSSTKDKFSRAFDPIGWMARCRSFMQFICYRGDEGQT